MKNAILKGITGTEIMLMILAASAMDSANVIIPVVVILQAAAWLALFALANYRSAA